MIISYAITIKNELEEIIRLISFLKQCKRSQDEIVVLFDDSGDKNVWQYLLSVEQEFKFKSDNPHHFLLARDTFNNDFSEWKNKLNKFCSGDWIINIDADEYPNIHLIENLPFILENNPNTDVFLVPRINTVSCIGLSHISKWGWKVSKLESMKEEKVFDLDNPKDLDEYNLLKQNNLIIEEKVIKI